ncbi:hypothetical protein BH10PSE1_BH10PSE1_17820 [soil metagenome]
MTDTYGAAPIVDDISDEDTAGSRLDRDASDYLARSENRAFGPTTSVRQAVRDDLTQARQIAREKAEAARDAIVEQPLKTALYAVGAGVLIGLLLRR